MRIQDLPLGKKETGWLEVASRPDGGTWRLPFLSVTGASDGPVLVIVAGVHGDEYEGVEAIPQVFQTVQPETLRGTLLMVPVCNMPAYETITRRSPIDGLNLARVFPGDANGSITQRTACWITEKLLKNADFFIDLHSGGATYRIPTLIGSIHGEGELERNSLEAARAFGAPVLWGHPLPVAHGRSISAATDLGVPSLYTEALGGGIARLNDVACFRDGVLNVLKWLDMLDGDPQPRPTTHHLFGEGNIDQAISAPVAGYYRPQVDLLDEVSAGRRLDVIQDFFGQVIEEIKADRDGVVIMLRRFHRVRVDDGLVHITGYVD